MDVDFFAVSATTSLNGGQWVVFSGFVLGVIACWFFGVRILHRDLARRRRGTTIPGVGFAVTLGGVALLLLLIDAIFAVLDLGGPSPVARWWFLPPPERDQHVYAFFATPSMTLLIVVVFVFFLGIPSRTQVSEYLRSFANPSTRSGTVWMTVIVAASLIGGTAGAWILASWIGSVGAIPGSFIGGFLAMGLSIGLGGLLTRSRRRPDAESGEAS